MENCTFVVTQVILVVSFSLFFYPNTCIHFEKTLISLFPNVLQIIGISQLKGLNSLSLCSLKEVSLFYISHSSELLANL